MPEWRDELKEALALDLDHLSLYQLTIEDGTAFGDRYKAGKLNGLPSEDLSADLYDVTQDLCAGAGLSAYEVSNHARPGAESVHNRIYWRYGDYAGIGPGAHGRVTIAGHRYTTYATAAPGAWLQDVRKLSSGEKEAEVLTDDQQRSEFLLMGLRLTEGVDLRRLRVLEDPDLLERIDQLQADGFVTRVADNLSVTQKGRPVLNAVLRQLLGA